MVATRSKVRRASTPLSSPPPSPPPSPAPPTPSYAFNSSSSSYYTDDQSDSCYGGDHGVNDESEPDTGSNSDDESEYDGNHEEHCDHHSTSLATHCNGRTYAGKRCSRKAHVFEDGMLPVCRSHQWYRGLGDYGKAGRCQARAECSYVCNRIVPYAPPFHFCDEHQKGTEALPCYITRLPTELRLMIFRYLFPSVIKPERVHRIDPESAYTAVLFVNRQFHEEAALLVYSELKFQVRIWPTFIELFGRRWDREDICHIFKELTKALCQPAARRIRHLDVKINFAFMQSNIRGFTGIDRSYEEYELYQLRDTIRKFVEVISPPPSDANPSGLKRLSITPAPSCRQLWQSDEATAAIFFVLQPFSTLRPIGRVVLHSPPRPTLYTYRERNFISVIADLHKDNHYCMGRKQWIALMTFGTEPAKSCQEISEAAALGAAYRKIEDFARLIYKQDAIDRTETDVKQAWTSSIFQGIERVLHIARVAYEDGDLECLKKIHEAILKRWIAAHQQQMQLFAAVAASVSDMFDGDVASRDEGYPEAFDFKDIHPAKQTHEAKDEWPEIPTKPPMPKLKGPGLTVEEKRQKVVVVKDGEKTEWAKTPAVVRQLRAYKQTNP
ncbi:hypothetical protein EKO04_002388 [Ascochyta lentis]|uniref:F-box domain-containing protein n=1 Tax=Ascochyta lentis TaxID=205686 RepID=A0A8H7JCK2_9PLEO|nr:hypothetical protein EKO04_002388 [Ascochyta lentis]